MYLAEKLSSPYTVFFLFLFIAGMALRLYELGAAPFWKAEMYNTWTGRNFIEGRGFSDPVGASSSYTRAWITSSLPIAVSFLLLGATEFAARLPSVLFGMATAFVGYKLLEELLNTEAGLIFLGLFAFDMIAVTWHRQARMYAQAQFFYILGVFLLSRWYNRDDLKLDSLYPLLLVPVALLGVHNHISFLGLGASFLVFMILSLLAIVYRQSEYSLLISHIFFRRHVIVITGLVISGMVFLVLNGVPSWLTGYTPDWYTHSRGGLFYLNFVLENSSLYFLSGLGLFTVWTRKNLWLPAVCLVVPFLVQSLMIEFKEPRMIFHLYPLMVLVAVKPLSDFIDFLSEVTRPELEKTVSLIFILVFIGIFQAPINSFNEVSNSSYGVINPKPDHRSATSYVERKRNSTDLVISSAPFITSWYLGNTSEIDYDLNPLNYRDTGSGPYSPRLGIKGIQDSEYMKQVIRENTGWIIADENFRIKTSKSIREAVKSNSRKVKSYRAEMIDIYRFD